MMRYTTNWMMADLEEGGMCEVETENGRLIVTLVKGKAVCFAAKCPHAGADLSEGGLANGRVSCPKHGWKFDVVSGRAVYPPDEACRLKRYSVEIVDEVVVVVG